MALALGHPVGQPLRNGFGPENVTRLRRFAVGILKSFQKPSHCPGPRPVAGLGLPRRPAPSIVTLMRKLSFRPRLVFDYLRMTKNSAPVTCSS